MQQKSAGRQPSFISVCGGDGFLRFCNISIATDFARFVSGPFAGQQSRFSLLLFGYFGGADGEKIRHAARGQRRPFRPAGGKGAVKRRVKPLLHAAKGFMVENRLYVLTGRNSQDGAAVDDDRQAAGKSFRPALQVAAIGKVIVMEPDMVSRQRVIQSAPVRFVFQNAFHSRQQFHGDGYIIQGIVRSSYFDMHRFRGAQLFQYQIMFDIKGGADPEQQAVAAKKNRLADIAIEIFSRLCIRQAHSFHNPPRVGGKPGVEIISNGGQKGFHGS